jgi:hypothetical protein
MAKTLSTQARLLILFGAALGLGLAFNYLFYEKVPGVSFLVFIALVAFSWWLVGSHWEVRFPRSAWITLIASIFFAAMVAVRANPFLSFLNVVASFYLLGISIVIVAGGFRWGHIRSFVNLFFLPIKFLGRLTWSISRFTELKDSGEKSTSHQVVRGVLMALPVLFLFTLLFASADLVIRDYLLRIFEIDNLPQALGRTIIVLIISTIATGMFGYLLSRMAKDDNDSADAATALLSKNLAKVSKVQISVFLGAIGVLFLIFISVQGMYFFGGDAGLAGQDFTYAEYARRGFFELLTVALITFVLLWASERSILRDGERHSRQFKMVSSVLVFEVLLIISSAFLRLRLYEDAYGFTTLRLWSHAFTVWLVVAFGLFIWKVLHDRGDKAFLVPAFVSLMLALAVMNALNPDAFIAQKNIDRLLAGERFDPSYMGLLSDDAMPQALAAFDKLQGEEKASFAKSLAQRYEDRFLEEYTSWQSFNLARKEAFGLLSTRIEEIRGYK